MLCNIRRDGQAPLFCPPSPKSKASPSGPSLNQAQNLRKEVFRAGSRVASLGSSEGVGCLTPGVSTTLKEATPSSLVVEPVTVVQFSASFASWSLKLLWTQRYTFSDSPANHPPWLHWSNQIPLVHKYHLIGILRLESTLMILSFWSPNPASAPQHSSGQSAPVAGRVRMFSLASFSLALYLNSHSPEWLHNAVAFHWMELTRRGALSKYRRKHPGQKEERNHGLADRIVWWSLKFPNEQFQLNLPDTDTLKGSRMGCSHKKENHQTW